MKLGEKRPERPPAQIAHLEQALPQVFPEVDPAGQRSQGSDAREPSGPGRSVGVCSLPLSFRPTKALSLDLCRCSVLGQRILSEVDLPRRQHCRRLIKQVTHPVLHSCHLY